MKKKKTCSTMPNGEILPPIQLGSIQCQQKPSKPDEKKWDLWNRNKRSRSWAYSQRRKRGGEQLSASNFVLLRLGEGARGVQDVAFNGDEGVSVTVGKSTAFTSSATSVAWASFTAKLIHGRTGPDRTGRFQPVQFDSIWFGPDQMTWFGLFKADSTRLN